MKNSIQRNVGLAIVLLAIGVAAKAQADSANLDGRATGGVNIRQEVRAAAGSGGGTVQAWFTANAGREFSFVLEDGNFRNNRLDHFRFDFRARIAADGSRMDLWGCFTYNGRKGRTEQRCSQSNGVITPLRPRAMFHVPSTSRCNGSSAAEWTGSWAPWDCLLLDANINFIVDPTGMKVEASRMQNEPYTGYFDVDGNSVPVYYRTQIRANYPIDAIMRGWTTPLTLERWFENGVHTRRALGWSYY